jgi:hypothetical protein
MSVDATGASAISVTGAIRQAAQKTGANFNYLLATAQSNQLIPAHSPRHHRRGLFQFIEQTGSPPSSTRGLHSAGRFADGISTNSSGRFECRTQGFASRF